MAEKKNGWGGTRAGSGGARPGAGAPPSENPRRNRVIGLLTDDESEALKAWCASKGKSASELVRIGLERVVFGPARRARKDGKR